MKCMNGQKLHEQYGPGYLLMVVILCMKLVEVMNYLDASLDSKG